LADNKLKLVGQTVNPSDGSREGGQNPPLPAQLLATKTLWDVLATVPKEWEGWPEWSRKSGDLAAALS
jgi:hypothetical protein